MDTKKDELTSPVVYKVAMVNNVLLQRVIVALALIILILGILIISLFPLKDTKVKVVEFIDGTNNFVRVIEPNESIQSDSLLIDYFVKKYVTDRETWNKVDEELRLPYIKSVSNEKTWNDMVAIFTHSKSPYSKSDFKRAIKIIRTSELSHNIRQVEFETSDIYGAGTEAPKHSKGYWIATLKMSFKTRDINYEDKDFNPLGLIVEEYSIAQRK
ncbi:MULTISPECIES: type IV secretion system protein [Arcobacteraceae]|uniref:P-type type IV conjugative transfer system protein TrbF/VirB8 n=1 Tax=Arcobacter porcinus TaxID=1935204 RepID=A0A5C2HET1_9BACT|nr:MULTISPECIES: type IV secretion system protein [Arcobacteraceae]OCL81906.1 Type IV secretion system protein PtlE [Arcobacter porcinus]OCL86250.1 Type IV secretion system protein PtlE [Arcobacter porcinus]OCL90593.1 Type IV secretion system protein PtlE [Aliarcobacter thereius]OCL94201.1 Type IV secretion system protein PtlE [Aliarcobacter thereius]QEP40905.1 P-type type IV conjugative transfer system protein TrbF/VirB8 [Arcobacter porcinus]